MPNTWEQQAAVFQRDGAVLLKGALDANWLRDLEAGLQQAYASPDGRSAGVCERLRIDHFPSDQIPALRKFIDTSPIAEMVGRILNSRVRFYMDQVFYKPEGAARAEARYQNEEPVIGVDAHDKLSYEQAFADASLPTLPDIETHRDSFDILGWDYEPGDVLLFHGHILHSARGDVDSPTPRRALATMWAGDDVHYLHRRGQVIPDPRALYDFKPKNGDTLDQFPTVFPVAWSP